MVEKNVENVPKASQTVLSLILDGKLINFSKKQYFMSNRASQIVKKIFKWYCECFHFL